MKWPALAICALASAAVATFAVWAFAVRDSGGTDYVAAEGSGNPAEDAWATEICTAVARWERAWKKRVIEPVNPTDPRTRAPITRVIVGMQRLTSDLRADVAQVVPPTDRVRKWQRYLAKTVEQHAEKFAKLEAGRLLGARDYLGPPARSRAGVLDRYAVRAWSDISDLLRFQAGLASPHLGVLFAEADACDEADRHSLTGTDWP